MNATDVAPQTKHKRLNRIKIVSRMVRYVIFGLFIYAVGFWSYFLVGFPKSFHVSVHTLSMYSMEIVLCIWYWKLTKLFRFYERGLIFATETIRCIKALGILCVINWLLLLAEHLNPEAAAIRLSMAAPPPNAKVYLFHLDFFSFSIYGINVGLLLAGIIIVTIAWIMDEGRKIQEEQELTV